MSVALCCTELEALGDDLLTEDDATFLDAAEAPEPPTKIPGGTETVSGKVREKAPFLSRCNVLEFVIFLFKELFLSSIWYSCFTVLSILLFSVSFYQDGVQLDEFGLPQI